MDNLKVSVCGVGVVGSAVLETFKKRNVNVLGYDKFKNIGTKESLLSSDIIFFCLPTLYSEELKEYNKSSIHEVSHYLSENDYKGLVVLKSTVEPGTSRDIHNKYNLRVVHNPEFLTAKTAKEDFDNQTHVVIGGKSKIDSNVKLLEKFYRYFWCEKIQYSLATWEETELMKIGVNSFYAVKIQFLNEIYLYSKHLKADYNNVKEIMLKNGWISEHHTSVPGTDGKLSYGGMCFPKDTNALCEAMKKSNVTCKVLEATISERNTLRDD